MVLRLRTSVLTSVALLLTLAAIGSPAIAHDKDTQLQLDRQYRTEGFVLQWDETSALPRKMVNATWRTEYRGKISGTPEQKVDAFLGAHAKTLFGTDDLAIGENLSRPSDIELRTVRIQSTDIGTSVRKQQYFRGVPVEGAIIHANVEPQGRVVSVYSDFQPALNLDVTPAMGVPSAFDLARGAIDRPGATRSEPQTQLMILPEDGGRLAYRTDLNLWAPYGDWRIFVDAMSGEVLSVTDRVIHRKGNQGRLEIEPHEYVPAPEGFTAGKRADGSGDVLPANPLNGEPTRYGLRDGDPVAGFVENMVLSRLDGTGLLRGDYADVDNSDAARANEPTLVFNYSPDVLNGNFHEVNIYWHIDEFQNYIQSTLGINYANNRQQPLFAHQGEDDNSSYSPGTGTIRFGDGGVDDSEDGEIVLHEYGHAVHDNISGIGGGEAGAISEGFGDYVAATFGDNPLVGEWDATSYNPGPPPFLRRTDGTKHYPEDLVGQVHADGEIISSAWWALRGMVGAETADALIIAAFAGVPATTTMPDFADATVQADIAMNGGANVGAIFMAYGDRGIGPAYLLDIVHTPLGDTEDTAGPYAVDASIVHTSPITDPNAVTLSYKLSTDGSFTTVTMGNVGGDDYSSSIPGPGVDATMEYYLSVTDDNVVTTTLPAGAPGSVLSFDIGTDSEAPVIVHTPLLNQALQQWPSSVNATVTDNLGIASVTLDWSLNTVPQAPIPMSDNGGGIYSATFTGAVNIGDAVEYSITAVDASSASNVSVDGPHSFNIIDAVGLVLIIDDDANTKGTIVKQDGVTKDPMVQEYDRPDKSKGQSATDMEASLTAGGFVVTVETVATTDPGTWSNYDFIISSSGRSNSPLADIVYRDALVAYAQGGGKLIIEGGEVGYASASFPGYPGVVNDVIHADTWFGDDSGDLQGVPSQAAHPIRTTPNSLPATIGVTYSSNYGDQDSVGPLGDAYLVFGTSDEPTTGAGILVFDDNAAPASAQIVYIASAFQQFTDPAVAADLIVNIGNFLVAEEGSADGCVAGTVELQNAPNHAGTTVSVEPGGFEFVTSNSGNYEICGLFPGSYTVKAQGPEGWESQQAVVEVVAGQTTDQDFELRSTFVFADCSMDTPLPIPDNTPAGITSQIELPVGIDVADVFVSVDITHTWRGDLIVELISPTGTVVRLHNRTGSSADDLVTSYDDVTEESGPGDLDDFNGEAAVGLWSLRVSDNAGADTGTLNGWCLTTEVTQMGVVPVAVSSFEAMGVDKGVELSWEAVAVEGLAGFNILRQTEAGSSKAINSDLIAPSMGGNRFVDPVYGVDAGAELHYALQGVMEDGTRQLLSDGLVHKYEPQLPRRYALDQNYPNPFNPRTTIAFALPSAGRTSIRIYDVAGRLVDTVLDEDMPAGRHAVEWSGKDSNGRGVSTGVYYYQVNSGSYRQTKRMTLVK